MRGARASSRFAPPSGSALIGIPGPAKEKSREVMALFRRPSRLFEP